MWAPFCLFGHVLLSYGSFMRQGLLVHTIHRLVVECCTKRYGRLTGGEPVSAPWGGDGLRCYAALVRFERRARRARRVCSSRCWRLYRWALSLWPPTWCSCSARRRLPTTRSRARTSPQMAQIWSTNHFFLHFAPPGITWSNRPAVTMHPVSKAHLSMGPRNFSRLDGHFRPMHKILGCKI